MALLSHRTPDSPEAKVTEGVSIDDYSTHGGRCGLQIEMRSTERGPKTAGFHVPNALTGCSRVRGGVEHDFRLRSTTATFVYMPHSAVVSILRRPYRVPRAACRAGDVSDPPQKKNRGVMQSRTDGICNMPLSPAPMGSLTSSFIPAGRLGKTPLSPRASSCWIGPRRQGFASPLRALDCSGPIRKTRCSRGERGGSGRGVRGRASA